MLALHQETQDATHLPPWLIAAMTVSVRHARHPQSVNRFVTIRVR